MLALMVSRILAYQKNKPFKIIKIKFRKANTPAPTTANQYIQSIFIIILSDLLSVLINFTGFIVLIKKAAHNLADCKYPKK
jgi:hypothetical protein